MRFPEVFIDWRWGSLLKVCDHLLSIKGVLVAHWNGKAMPRREGRNGVWTTMPQHRRGPKMQKGKVRNEILRNTRRNQTQTNGRSCV